MRTRLERMVRAVLLLAALWPAAVPATHPAPGAAPGPCAPHGFEGMTFTVCTIDLRTHELQLFWKDGDGLPYGAFARLPERIDGRPLAFAMNAGMYHPDLSPAGLYVEGGVTLRPLNTADGPGNFHMKPNGVFFVADGRAGVLTAETYAARAPDAEIATQSGPMLVIRGRLHPRFLPDSDSRRLRNGVGVRDAHTVVFAISESVVTLHEFARLFRDSLGCKDALYLDGTMSSLYDPARGRADARRPMGPIIGAVRRE